MSLETHRSWCLAGPALARLRPTLAELWGLLFVGALLVGPLLVALACGASDPVAEVRELQARGQYAESLEPLRELLETRSDDAEVHYLYGLALSAAGKPTLAQWSFRKALEDEDWRKSAAMQLASGAVQTGNHEAAITAATQALEIEPDSVDALLIRTHSYVSSRRNYEGALADADRILELDPENSTALSLRGAALLGLERVEEAQVVVEELERRFREENLGLEDTARYCATRATFFKESGDLEEAERLFDECLETFPTRAVVVEGAVELLDEQGRYDKSLEVLQRALEEAPFSPYRNVVAGRMRATGDVEGAERVLKEGTELEAPHAVLASWVHLSHHYLELGEIEPGLEAMKSALEAGGDKDPQLQFDYAEALVMAERYDEAEAAARELELPAYRELILGRSLLARGKSAEALEHFTQGLLLWPDSAGGRYYAALAAEQSGDFDRAIAEYRYSIRSDPAATDARLRLARLHAAEGSTSLALTVARQGSGRYGPDLEAQIFVVRLAAETGQLNDLRGYLKQMEDDPRLRARSLAAAAEGIRARQGAPAAVRFLIEQQGLDLVHPRSAPALRVLTRCAGEAGTAQGALDSVDNALARYPNAAALHEIRGLALSQAGAPSDQVRAAYERALELDSDQALAMLGLAGLARQSGDLEQALEHYRRAAEADVENPEPLREMIVVLGQLGRAEAVEAELEKLLVLDPYDAAAAIQLATLLIDREGQGERSLELAERAVRFQGGADAYELLSRVHRRNGDAGPAAEATARAEEIRTREARGAGVDGAPATPAG